jgi:hypothetical protein
MKSLKKINDNFIPKNPYTLLQYINELYNYWYNLRDNGNLEKADEFLEVIRYMEKRLDEILYIVNYDLEYVG